MRFKEEREQVAYFMRRLYRQGLTTTSGGNVSRRADDAHIVLSASASDKGELQAEDVGVMTLEGKNATPGLKPSIESEMHLEVYRRHADVEAIVHAHPVTASLFTASDATINTHLTAEAYAILGEPVRAEYACMGTPRLADVVADAVSRSVCVLMRNHGVLTVGASLLEAFDRIEVLEVAARQTVLSFSLKGVRGLGAVQRTELDVLMGRGPGGG